MIGAFMSMFDSGVVNVGLPVIARQFSTDMGSVQWIASIYLLIMSALLPILGTIADHFGRRRIYNLGYFVISIFTLACGFSVSLPMLIAMRILQGVGGAIVMANGMAIVTENYPPSERGRNIGLLATMMAIGSIAGPPLGGVAIGLWGWRSVFYLTFVVSIAGFFMSYFTIPRDRRTAEAGYCFDVNGSLLLIASIVTFIYGFSNLSRMGWKNPMIWGSILVFAVSFILLLIIEAQKTHPVVHIGLFGNWIFSSSIIASLLSFVTMYSPTILSRCHGVRFTLQRSSLRQNWSDRPDHVRIGDQRHRTGPTGKRDPANSYFRDIAQFCAHGIVARAVPIAEQQLHHGQRAKE
jgi:multidrug resistance protein